MKVLAEYVMTGPKQASIFCLGFGFLPIVGPWLSSAAIALVVLQVGVVQASKVLPWAVMPGLVWLALGETSYLLLLLSVFVGAALLEYTRSLAQGILAAVLMSAVGFLVMVSLMPESLDRLSDMMVGALEKSPEFDRIAEKQLEVEGARTSVTESAPLTETERKNGLKETLVMLTYMAYAWAGGVTACLVLLIGRWWQSLLYRPGAFQTEFHGLRMNWGQVIVVMSCIVLSMQGINSVDLGDPLLRGSLGTALAPVFSIPMMFAGVALVHGMVAIAGMSVHWLGLFYMALLFIGHLVYLPLVTTALIDVVIDFRGRFRKSKAE